MKFSRFQFVCVFLLLTISSFAQSEKEKGVELYPNGDFDGAITVLQKVVQVDKSDRKAWTYLGASYVKNKKSEDAYQAFRKADLISLINLSEDEQSNLSDGLKIIAKPRANYTDLARSNGIQGRVSLAVEFMKDGKIGFVSPINVLKDGLTEQCISAVRKIKFEPARKKGDPVSVVGIIYYSFTIY